MLSLQNINLTFNSGSNFERQIFKGLNFEIKEGEFITLIGGNGAGKSTMFNIISGYIKPDSGNLMLNGQDITSTPQHMRASLISKVMQDPRMGTISDMTIEENMSFAYMRGQSRYLVPSLNSNRRKLFRNKLAMLGMGLEDKLDMEAGKLSGGQRQALSLIMAILTDSKILLLDEITAALDPKTAETVMQIAANIVKEEKRTTIMITHNMAHAIEYGDRTLLLANGNIAKEFNARDRNFLTPEKLNQEFHLS